MVYIYLCFTAMRLFYFNFPDSFFALDIFLRKFDFQDTVIVAGIDITGLNIVHAEASGIRAVISFSSDIFIFVFLVFFFFVRS